MKIAIVLVIVLRRERRRDGEGGVANMKILK
jgi:hypothetical protein